MMQHIVVNTSICLLLCSFHWIHWPLSRKVNSEHFTVVGHTNELKLSEFLYNAVLSLLKALYSLTDLFNRTPSQFIWEVFSQDAINARRLFIHKCQPSLTARWRHRKTGESRADILFSQFYADSFGILLRLAGWLGWWIERVRRSKVGG